MDLDLDFEELSRDCDFTPESLMVISFAKSECIRSGNNLLGSKLLLYGILKQEKNAAANYLHQISDSIVDEILEEIEQMRPLTCWGLSSEQIMLSDNALQILTSSSYVLDKLVETRTPELLMLGILDRKNCGALDLLYEHDVDLYGLHHAIIQAIRSLDSELITTAEIKGTEKTVETIQIICLPIEDGRCACAIEGFSGLFTFLEYGDTKQEAMSSALRYLARVVLMGKKKFKAIYVVNSIVASRVEK